MITRMDLYGYDDLSPRDSIWFVDHGKAEDARRELLADPGLEGIAHIEFEFVPTDADGVKDFYDRMMAEAEADR